MSIICPTVTAYTVDEYEEQLTFVTSLAKRIHLDVAEESFTGHQTVSLTDIHRGAAIEVDIHYMGNAVEKDLEAVILLKPQLVIVHAEADLDHRNFIDSLHSHHIKAGIALLQDTTVKSVAHLLPVVDHVLIFSGALGSFGGKVDLSLLRKVNAIRSIKQDIEIGWDGGITVDTVHALEIGGVDVLNVGGAIHLANYPQNAYQDLQRQLSD